MKTHAYLSAALLLALYTSVPLLRSAEETPKPRPGMHQGKVDLNTADIPTLEAIPEIGPEFANAIVTSRPFKSVDDLSRIHGITSEKLKTLRTKLSVSPPKLAAPTPPDPRTGTGQPAPKKVERAIKRTDVTERYDRAQQRPKEEPAKNR